MSEKYSDGVLDEKFNNLNEKLDDHFEAWFLSEDVAPSRPMEGMESVVSLGQSQEWPPPPTSRVPGNSVVGNSVVTH